jgi:SAM-dependent methyltransferase
MSNLPFKNNIFDCVICCNLLEIAKNHDINKNQYFSVEQIHVYPTVINTLKEISRVLVSEGIFFLTTPNNAYYKTTKLTFEEIRYAFIQVFENFKISFYNTYARLGKNRKFNLANVFPKFNSRFKGCDNVIKNLLKEESVNKYSVSFFVEGKKIP